MLCSPFASLLLTSPLLRFIPPQPNAHHAPKRQRRDDMIARGATPGPHTHHSPKRCRRGTNNEHDTSSELPPTTTPWSRPIFSPISNLSSLLFLDSSHLNQTPTTHLSAN